MKIEKVTTENIHLAAFVHAESWKASHGFLPKEAVAKRTVERQTVYLQRQIDGGKDLYMLTDDIPVGIVSVSDNMIENLYVLPERWHCGYGSHLLAFAIGKCDANPVLTVLNNNTAIEMYRKFGFKETGRTIPLNPELWEIEMILER
ncbi:MAG: GNAT family N-acetyltransferase [Oscillospiraceae bacterium]|nr:GNAT family N-acetyltransferase [Oscillospiraceae bacterium]